ncbi:malto-oligosyltrehalose synthase [Propioniferax innocua]|nr:malto-oligosyltrehalose synthase [Propioniferax innocua]
MTVPSSTYRLQLSAEFTLDDAAALMDYLQELGVGAVYLSPVLTATKGSTHGYDTTDPTSVDPERGGEEAWSRLLTAAKEHGLAVVVDIVPNHVGVSAPQENHAWWDVLTHGPDAARAHWFDIDWTRGKLLVPILGSDADTAELSVDTSGDEPLLAYYDHRFPLAPGTWSPGADLSDVLAQQHYELVDWRRGDSELNYRRFFTITTLAGIRQEDPDVFAATHARIARMLAEGVGGLRVDHPDGVADPADYFSRLRDLAGEKTWLLGEKILEPGEKLPDWPIEGTTGYDALREVEHAFIDTAKADAFDDLYRRYATDQRTFTEHVGDAKRRAATELLAAERARMLRVLGRDDAATTDALAELAVAMPVYRTYPGDTTEPLDQAVASVTDSRPDLTEAVAALRPMLTTDPEMSRRFGQYSGAVMAKGVEDTTFYRWSRFVGLNEVGGDPATFGGSLDAFHDAQQERQSAQPQAMTALATHDTKRGEDVRARLAALSEVPVTYGRFLEELEHHTEVPNGNFLQLIAQTVVGAGIIERQRLHDYVIKAAREASQETTWTQVNETFEQAITAAVDACFDHESVRVQLDRLLSLIEQPGWSNSLGRKLVQLTMPGVPDVYQGTEMLDDSLVDPDNRRPVDYSARRAMLDSTPLPWLDGSGAAKFHVVRTALRLRRECPELFTGYTPMHANGDAADHFLGFDRGGALTAVTRLPYGLGQRDGWGDTSLMLQGSWTDQLTGAGFTGEVRVNDLFDHYPVALLTKQ